MLKKIIGLYFSPTDESAAIIRGITDELARRLNQETSCEVVSEFHDLASMIDLGQMNFDDDSVVVLGVPSIKKRIPMPCLRLLQHLHGNDTRAITVITSTGSYGNSLYDLYAFTSGQGFEVISAASFIARNAGTKLVRRVRGHRPDEADIDKIVEFCRVAANKLQRLSGCEVGAMKVKAAPLDIECQHRSVIGKVKRQEPEWYL